MSMHERPTLFFEFHGATEREVEDQLQSVSELFKHLSYYFSILAELYYCVK